jgi:hypothetical protein
MEMDQVWRNTMDAAFGFGDTLEDGDGFGFNPIGEVACVDQLADFGVIALGVTGMGRVMAGMLMGVLVTVAMSRVVLVLVLVLVRIGMRVAVGVVGAIGVGVLVGVGKGSRSKIKIRIKIGTGRRRKMDVEFGAGDQGFLTAGAMEVITFEAELFELVLKQAEVGAHIDQGSDKHVATDAAEQIKIKGLHGATRGDYGQRALIWAAA